MEIPQNTQVDNRKENLIKNVLKTFETDSTFQLAHYGNHIPLSIAEDVARMFVNKGYHAKITHFCDGRAPYQFLVISKCALGDRSGMMTYTNIIG